MNLCYFLKSSFTVLGKLVPWITNTIEKSDILTDSNILLIWFVEIVISEFRAYNFINLLISVDIFVKRNFVLINEDKVHCLCLQSHMISVYSICLLWKPHFLFMHEHYSIMLNSVCVQPRQVLQKLLIVYYKLCILFSHTSALHIIVAVWLRKLSSCKIFYNYTKTCACRLSFLVP